MVQVEDEQVVQILYRVGGNVRELVLGHVQLRESLTCIVEWEEQWSGRLPLVSYLFIQSSTHPTN